MSGSPGVIVDIPITDAVAERYLTYALSTIVSRSLPDARDGLKPVHRRLLFAMRELKLDPRAGFKKCARVVGDVIGKFHPHGDVAVYDALVRLAQAFSLRYPLIEGHGNFGTIDGDGAAAMRYTEARMTEVAAALLDGIDEDAVDLRPTYDGQEEEPTVLPGAFPNLLANGASGIAVGLATSIPPHHVGEVCAAARRLIAEPDASVAALLADLPGPDFPTGGIISERAEDLRDAYETGRGAFRLRARWHVEDEGRGERRLVITEIPYQVQKSRLIEQIANLLEGRKAPFAAEVRDESGEQVRIVLRLKEREAKAAAVMGHLFRHTELEVRIGLNMNVLIDGRTPRLLGLKGLLRVFLDHRLTVLKRRTRFRLARIAERLEIVSGLLLALADLDTVIRIIREEDEPKPALMAHFGISDRQAEAILNMRLRQLRRLNEIELRAESGRLTAEQADLQALLADEGRCWAAIDRELAAIAERFGDEGLFGPRRTAIVAPGEDGEAAAVGDGDTDADGGDQPLTVVCSARGWVRAIPGEIGDTGAIRYKEGDQARFVLAARRRDRLMIFGSNGRAYTLACDRLPADDGAGRPLRLLIDLGEADEALRLLLYRPGQRLLLAADSGRGFVVAEEELLAQTRAGRQVLVLDEGERAVACVPVGTDDDTVAVVGSDRRLLVFPLTDVPAMARGKGVLLKRSRGGVLADVALFVRGEGLSWPAGQGRRKLTDVSAWEGRRGQTGKPVPKGFPASNRFG